MRRPVLAALFSLFICTRAFALDIARLTAAPVIDGALDDAAWSNVPVAASWYDFDPGDNVAPPVRTEARVAIDGANLYVAFRCFDPHPGEIRAPFSARDAIASDVDYAGIFVDSHGDGRSAQFFLGNARGVQRDGIRNDATGDETIDPDFLWDAAARIDAEGWTLELRIPLASLRYSSDAPRWRVLLVRNWTRGQRHRIASTPIPRGSSCIVCHADVVGGLELPRAAHVTAVPYVAASREGGRMKSEAGGDLQYAPTPNVIVDATLNPDFSQVESDTPEVSANQRFAIFYPEKRPLFLEGLQLFDTPLPVVSTRTITSPRWGARVTRTSDRGGFTLLVAQDRGGGTVIIPGRLSSSFAPQAFRSLDWIARGSSNFGSVKLGAVATDREVSGGGNNRVVGADVQWTRRDVDVVTAELLGSRSKTPVRPDLAAEWDGRTPSGTAANVIWKHATARWDWYDQYIGFSDGFRADHGFVPQVGFHELYTNTGYTVRPRGFLNNIRFYVTTDYEADPEGDVIYHVDTTGADMLGAHNSMFRARFAAGELRAGSKTIRRNQLLFIAQASPSKRWTLVGAEGSIGQQIDFDAERRGTGAAIHYYAAIQPLDRLEVALDGNLNWAGRNGEGRFFTAQTERLRTTWAFDVRSSLRAIVQNERTVRAATPDAAGRDGSLTASLLFQYRLTYATGLFIGAGDSRVLDPANAAWRARDRSLFVKVSYGVGR
ncbi:MAG: carbohydrate binding family 9 domain-containing protein [Acidobacteria bacterium]|nr:carbohydrate binding family 9 domain-containing protein [Acidobacteriota bacterium]MBV9477965.1 carbohydrate binding family 9 domain-containing protein [Acidobacteriota bacterium]